MLLAAGHEVTGTTRTPRKAGELERAGAHAVVLDALRREAVFAAVRDANQTGLAALLERIGFRESETRVGERRFRREP